MKRSQVKPDTEKALAGLKDFQRRTVDYVFKRMYLDEDRTKRFLIADEAGLGKTMVAKGVIARVIDHLWKKDNHRIDVVYICSNADIARQNIKRLNVSGVDQFTLPDRITELPVYVSEMERNRLNFVAFTPGTSFHLKSSSGKVRERALLYCLLRKHWALRGKAPKYVFRGRASCENLERWISWYQSDQVDIDKKLFQSFLRELDHLVQRQRRDGEEDLESRSRRLCKIFCRYDSKTSLADRQERDSLIGDLRNLLAKVCLEALEPDLIIMDEFQRFRNLLQGEDDAGVLARDLFNYAEKDGANPARVLLLSATPYKMYTLNHESEEDDHYEDFMCTLRFLNENHAECAALGELLGSCGSEYFRPESMSLHKLAELKAGLEGVLRKVMVRTEKLSSSDNKDAMLRHIPAPDGMLTSGDVQAFLKYRTIADYLDEHSPLEYWRASPYLFNFMDSYRMKMRFTDEAGGQTKQEFRALLKQSRSTLLKWADIASYRKVDPANAKLRALIQDTVGRGMWRLLWLPPSLSYYELEGAYADAEARGYSKRLIFSCWHVVPKVVAAMVSYEVERLANHAHDRLKNTAKDRKKRSPLLRFAYINDRHTGLQVMGMIYPGIHLALLCDPLKYRQVAGNVAPVSLGEILENSAVEIDRSLSTLNLREATEGAADEKWYWAAPILLDAQYSSSSLNEWLEQRELSELWRKFSTSTHDDDDHGRWGEHVEKVVSLVRDYHAGTLELGRRPADLPMVLARVGVGGLGCCAIRALTRRCGSSAVHNVTVRNAAGALAHAMLPLFNSPEAMSIIRGLYSKDYWQAVLQYCCEGGLQPVLDEYLSVLHDAVGTLGATEEEKAGEYAKVAASSMTFRTGRVGVDNIRISGDNVSVSKQNMRVRFALRFGVDAADDGGRATREDHVRSAFNSPFWPFVLASTSIGQEGLDFHHYCHAIVHWNLPSNPVDLEQREGRVHRYKGYAVRKNLAREFAEAAWADSTSCPWEAMFEEAHNSRPEDKNDIYPFWILPSEGGAKIERHVLALPLSREERKLQELRRTLVAYRMVFGQSRQEDMLEYLMEHVPEAELQDMANVLRINLEPV